MTRLLLKNKLPGNAESAGMPLISDKLMIPHAAPRAARGRLLTRLHESLTCCTSTIINGRAGTGKTMLAVDFARRCERRIAWYKVDASDCDLQIFLQYLVGSVRGSGGRHGFGRETLARLAATSAPEELPKLAETFVYELSERRGEPLLIVVDDLHLIYDAEWVVPFFHRLLPLLPAEAHMLITSRSLPPAPLWRMRSKQTLCVIDEPALAFTVDEARSLFKTYGLMEAPEARATLKQTRGRAAALDAMARSLSARKKAAA